MTDSLSQATIKRYDLFVANVMKYQEEEGMTNPVFADYCNISIFTWRSMRLGTARAGGYNMIKINIATGVQI